MCRVRALPSVVWLVALSTFPSHAEENYFFSCTPSGYKDFEGKYWDCQQAEANAKRCIKRRIDMSALTASGGYYIFTKTSEDSIGDDVHQEFKLSRATGEYTHHVEATLDNFTISGTCELRKETLKF
jgi:hypothetical protein